MTTQYIVSNSHYDKKKNKSIMEKIHDIKSNKHHIRVTKVQKKTSSNNWMARHLNDPFVQASKAEGFVSRAAYKLIEINDKYKILKPDSVILDVGCCPGSWLQAIWITIKSKNSLLVGIDLLPPEQTIIDFFTGYNSNIHILQGDFFLPETQENILSKLKNQKINCLVSDIAPNTTGIQEIDHLQMMEMVRGICDFMYKNLAKNGNFISKIFDGSETKQLISELKPKFNRVVIYKPLASRANSAETYLVGIGFVQ